MNVEDKAKELVNRFVYACLNEGVKVPSHLLPGLLEHAASIARPPASHIIDETGAVRRVLGTLPVTKDGCVIGNGTPDLCSEGPYFEPIQVLEVRTIARNVRFVIDDGTRYIPEWKPADCYSTRAAAEAARVTA